MKINEIVVNNLTPENICYLRAFSQGLIEKRPSADLKKVVASTGGINAQQKTAMRLSLRARIAGLEIDQIDKEIRKGSLVKNWSARGTLHLMTREDEKWIVPHLGPIFSAKDKRRRLQLGLTDRKVSEGIELIKKILKVGTHLTKDQLMDELLKRKFVIDKKKQAPAHLLYYGALQGVIGIGPDQDGDATYYLKENGGLSETMEEFLLKLSRRYIGGFAPASLNDFAEWSGLTRSDAKKAWQLLEKKEKFRNVSLKKDLWATEEQLDIIRNKSQSTVVRLLPAFDESVLGYSDRDEIVAPQYKSRIYHGGQTVPVIVISGQVAGVWRYDRKSSKTDIVVRSFDRFGRETLDLIEEEATDIGRFFNSSISLKIS